MSSIQSNGLKPNPINDPFYFWEERDYYKKFGSFEKAVDNVLNGRKEKSIRRSFYIGYEEPMNLQVWYSVKPAYIITRIFKDVNFVSALLKSKLKDSFFEGYDAKTTIELFSWLQQYYSEKELFKLFFDEIVNHDYKFRPAELYLNMKSEARDILSMLDNILKSNTKLLDSFEKVQPNMLHDVLSFIQNSDRNIFEVDYTYERDILNYEGELEELSFILPKNSLELQHWAKKMSNCMLGRDNEIFKGETAIVGVFKSQQLKYAIEVRDKNIVEAKAKYNKKIPDKDYNIIEKWLRNK